MIKAERINFSYGNQNVLKQVELAVEKGCFISVIGPNGSGKTTLLKNLCRLLQPQSGEVKIDALSIKAYKPKMLAKKMAVVHQEIQNTFDFNIHEVVLMGRYPHLKALQYESAEDLKIVEKTMHLTGIHHLRHKSMSTISGGERQRVMIAKALTQEPDLLLLDEPISHLDLKYQLEVLKLCKSLNREKQLTILTTLHDINLAARFSDVIILMHHGEIVKVGPPAEVLTSELIRNVYEVDVTVIHEPHLLVIPH